MVARAFKGKWGGGVKAWESFLLRLSREKNHEEFMDIYNVLMNTEKASWLRRTKNTLFFFNILKMFKIIENHHVREIELENLKNWGELTVNEKRALLLFSFKKWWWDSSSQHTEGLGKWTKPSFILTELLLKPMIPQQKLSQRLDELLGSSANSGFFSNLFRHFSNEIQIFKSIQNDSQSLHILKKSLEDRMSRLRQWEKTYKDQTSLFQKHYMEITLQRTEVLLALLNKGSALSQKEIRSLGVSPKSAYILKLSRLSSITNDFVMQTALFIMMAYLIQSFFDQKTATQPVTGSFSDFFKNSPSGFMVKPTRSH